MLPRSGEPPNGERPAPEDALTRCQLDRIGLWRAEDIERFLLSEPMKTAKHWEDTEEMKQILFQVNTMLESVKSCSSRAAEQLPESAQRILAFLKSSPLCLDGNLKLAQKGHNTGEVQQEGGM